MSEGDSKVFKGNMAEKSFQEKEALLKLINTFTSNHEIVIVSKDCSNTTTPHVHVQGPMHDILLLYGLLERGKDGVRKLFDK